MSWNPFKRRDEKDSEPGVQASSEPLAMPAGEDDPTDPLINTAAYAENTELIHSWPGIRLEQVTIGDAVSPSDSFLKLLIEAESSLSRALPQILTVGGAVFGLRDLLADGKCALAAALDTPSHTLQEFAALIEDGSVAARQLDILQAIRDLAQGLDQARRAGLGWRVSPAGLSVEGVREAGHATGRWQLRFTAFGELQEEMTTDAAEIITLLRPLLDGIAGGATDRLLPQATHLQPIGRLLDQLQADDNLSLLALRDAIDDAISNLAISGLGMTDTGLKRKHNEDAWCIADVNQQAAVGSHFLLAAVADGMGGHESGEIASSLALAMLRQQLQAALTAPSTRSIEHSQLPTQLSTLIPGINRALCDRSAMDSALAGMGTTLCGFALLRSGSTIGRDGAGSSAAVFNVGDSRCYLIGPRRMQRLSRDHSFVQGLVDNGEITEEQAFDHPRKNVITRCLGGDGLDTEADVLPFSAGPGERLLICSDGLTDALRDSEIRAVLTRCADEPLARVAHALVDAANAAGGPDNITVLLLDCLL